MWELRELVRELNLEEFVKFLGWVDEPVELYRQSCVGIQTSRTEGLSLALLEQMMSGLCVVATDVGDTGSAIEQGECGFLYPVDDQDALANILRRLLQDPQLVAHLGARARKRCLDHFSLESLAEQVEQHALGR